MDAAGDKGGSAVEADQGTMFLDSEAPEFMPASFWERQPVRSLGNSDAVGGPFGSAAPWRALVALAPAALLLLAVLPTSKPQVGETHARLGAPGSVKGSEGLLMAFSGAQQDSCRANFADQDASAECFCQISRNPGCSGRRCSCKQACPSDGAKSVWRHPKSVSVRNAKNAHGCSGKNTAIVTVSKSYFASLHDMKTGCPDRMLELVTEMLLAGFRVYQQNVGTGAVRHCIKGQGTPGTPWLHVTTFCAEGELDRMPSSTRFNWCTTMTSETQAQWAATLAIVWAGGPYNLPPPISDGPAAAGVQPVTMGPGSLMCSEVGCGNRRPEPECSCNDACRRYGDCCPDYDSLCQATNVSSNAQCYFKYSGVQHGPLCFCQLAGNAGCAKKRCDCHQGCTGEALLGTHDYSVTFSNVKQAHRCIGPSTALLTIPKSYYSNIQSLKAKCSMGMVGLLTSMLKASFETYQNKVAQGPVSQCIHAAHWVSVDWLHIHTFCPGGSVDNLPGSSKVGWCATMYSTGDAQALAQAMVAWASQ